MTMEGTFFVSGVGSLWASGSLAARTAKTAVGPAGRLEFEVTPIVVKFGLFVFAGVAVCLAASVLGRRFR